MTGKEFLRSKGMTGTHLAGLTNCSIAYLFRQLNGEREASPDIAERVGTATDGQITAQEFLAQCMAARASRQVPPMTASHIPGEVASNSGARP